MVEWIRVKNNPVVYSAHFLTVSEKQLFNVTSTFQHLNIQHNIRLEKNKYLDVGDL